MVTVLMPVRDTPRALLAGAVESILRQTFRDFEFLILDDGSTRTETCDYLGGITDPRVHVERGAGCGLTRTLNIGLNMARGDLIARQDSDDWSDPERLAAQVAYFTAHWETVLCGTCAWLHQCDGTRLWRVRLPVLPRDVLAAFEHRNPFMHGAVMFRRTEALAAGGYREEFRCSQDYDFFWRLAERGAAANLAEPLYHYRYRGGSESERKAVEQAVAHIAARALARARHAGEMEDPSAALLAAARELESGSGVFQAELKQADHLLLAGAYRAALASYLKLVAKRPASWFAWGTLARWGVFRMTKCGFSS